MCLPLPESSLEKNSAKSQFVHTQPPFSSVADTQALRSDPRVLKGGGCQDFLRGVINKAMWENVMIQLLFLLLTQTAWIQLKIWFRFHPNEFVSMSWRPFLSIVNRFVIWRKWPHRREEGRIEESELRKDGVVILNRDTQTQDQNCLFKRGVSRLCTRIRHA